MILAETLKDITNAPPYVIQQLARDTEIEVAGPVLRYSPLLSDDDLLEIIKAGPIFLSRRRRPSPPRLSPN